MDEQLIAEVVQEISPLLTGHFAGKIFQFNSCSLAIDFHAADHRYLFVDAAPAHPRLYLIKRRTRDLEKQSQPLGLFAALLRKELSQKTLSAISKDAGERIVRFFFHQDGANASTLIAQLTGRSANLFLLNAAAVIISHCKPGRGSGQSIGETYQPPRAASGVAVQSHDSLARSNDSSISATLDAHYAALDTRQLFDSRAAVARAELRNKIARAMKLLAQLQGDLATHVDYERQKRIGDLLLANVSNATRAGNRVKLIDYFSEGEPEVEIEIDQSSTLPEEAARRFNRYARSKRATKQITARIERVEKEISDLNSARERLDNIIHERDESKLDEFTNQTQRFAPPTSTLKRDQKIPGTRRYLSTDGFEVLVGRAAKDNDNLTFKVARPNDLWLHAADYPGSHVIVRGKGRKEIPHRTVLEAAQLAAHFSQAKDDSKVNIHYTQRKFLSKVKGGAPGLVRISRFKHLTVQPKEDLQRF